MDIEKEFEELKKLIENAWASGYTVDLRTALERLERIRKEIGV
jgi:hypothetical protein